MATWHCYINNYDSVYSANVEAETAEEAAIKAATSQNQGGTWNVVKMDPNFPGPMEIEVHETKTYRTR